MMRSRYTEKGVKTPYLVSLEELGKTCNIVSGNGGRYTLNK